MIKLTFSSRDQGQRCNGCLYVQYLLWSLVVFFLLNISTCHAEEAIRNSVNEEHQQFGQNKILNSNGLSNSNFLYILKNDPSQGQGRTESANVNENGSGNDGDDHDEQQLCDINNYSKVSLSSNCNNLINSDLSDGEACNICQFMDLNDDCQDKAGLVNWLALYYCREHITSRVFLLILYAALFILLGSLMSTTADYFFCPPLTYISDALHLSPPLAGITFLAVGNGAADIFTAHSALKHQGDLELVLSALFGGALVVISAVLGLVLLAAPKYEDGVKSENHSVKSAGKLDHNHFKICKWNVTRDVIMTLLVCVGFAFICDQDWLKTWEAYAILAFYGVYIVVAFTSIKLKERLTKTEIVFHQVPKQSVSPYRKNSDYGIISQVEAISPLKSPNIDSKLLTSSSPFRLNIQNSFNDYQATINSQNLPYSPNLKDTGVNNALMIPNTISPKQSGVSNLTEKSDGSIQSISRLTNLKSHRPAFLSEEAEYSLSDVKHEDSKCMENEDMYLNGSSDGEINQIQSALNNLNNLERQKELESFGSPFKGSEKNVDYPEVKGDGEEDEDLNRLDGWDKPEYDLDELTLQPKKTFYNLVLLVQFYVEIPFTILRYISCPPVHGYTALHRFLCIIWPLPFCCLMQLSFFSLDSFDNNLAGVSQFPAIILVVIASLLSSLIIALLLPTVASGRQPGGLLKGFFVFIAFLSAMAWLNIISAEMVALVEALGVLLDVNISLLGLTIIAAANCITDAFANTAIARNGRPVMGIAACLGSPILNILIGFGVALLSYCYESGPYKTNFKGEHMGPVKLILIFVAISALAAFIGLYMNKWKPCRSHGYVMIGIYAIFLLLVTLTETRIIPPDTFFLTW